MNFRRTLAGALSALTLAGCLGVGADHERLGDEAIGRGNADQAISEYQAALAVRGSAQLYAKLGGAALRARRYREAATAYRDLVADDPSRLDEAATGLELAAEGAEHANDAAGLAAAVTTLRDVAPDRLVARHALALVRMGGLSATEQVAVLPFALAAAPDAGVTDSLLVAFGAALRETGVCDDAMRAFEAARRRTRDRRLGDLARTGITACGVSLGEAAVAARDPFAADRWLTLAVSADSNSLDGRRARLGLGDLRRAQGDLLGAAMAYQAVLSISSTDSLGNLARERLDVLGAAPDTTK
jgi:tetratricopeptide (TPR) repeat protein